MAHKFDETIEIKKGTIATIISMLTQYSKYVETSEDLGINLKYDELKKIRQYINYYDIDDMIDYLNGKIDK